MSSIAICMIVKNEEEVLARALANWRELGDELIIVDTGSTDRTVEIAQAHDALVMHYGWVAPGNKGEARMVGINAARSRWIVVLDADEVIDRPAYLREYLLGLDQECSAVNVKFTNYDDNGNATLIWYQTRVFRREQYRYIHREHEIPTPIGAPGDISTIDVNFEHRPPLNRAPTKINPMLERLELDVQEHPDDPHSVYMLARQYGHCQQYEKAIEACKQYMCLEKGGFRADVCRLAGICANAVGRRMEMIEWFYRALAYEPMRRRLWIELAHIYFDDRHYAAALTTARVAAELPLPAFQREIDPVEQLQHICQLIEASRAQLASEHHH